MTPPPPAYLPLIADWRGHPDERTPNALGHRNTPLVTGPGWGLRCHSPRWQDASATLVEDVGTFEERKLWLLNACIPHPPRLRGNHQGYETIDQAMGEFSAGPG